MRFRSPSFVLACAGFTASLLLSSKYASANPYESFISIDNEDDLFDLQAAQAITDDTFNQLLDLLARGVDLNEADRAELYELPNLTYDDVDAIIKFREQQGRIRDPADLVAAGALSQEKLFAIAAFLVQKADKKTPLNAHGFIRVLTRGSIKDSTIPATTVRGRTTALQHWSAGFVGTISRLRIDNARWDATRQALVADGPAIRFRLPKVYARYKADNYDLIAGSYRLGFGQRLTFDNTIAYNPNGIYQDDQVFFDTDLTRSCREGKGELSAAPCDTTTAPYVTPDFRIRDGLFGVAGGAKHLPLGEGWLQLYTWASYSRRSIYQYELVNRGICADPSDDRDPACSSPDIFRRPNGALSTPTSEFTFQTVPNVFGEILGGANATYFVDRRTHFGVTGYGAHESQLIGGVNLDTQEYSRIPTGRSFGAVGANAAYGRKWLDVFGEFAHSFDKSPNPEGPLRGGGGPAAIVRATATQKGQELEVSARYYSADFANPFARPLAAPDEVNGQRARDEIGGRIRHTFANKRFSFRTYIDFWRNISTKIPNIDTWVRNDVRIDPVWSVGLWARYRDKDLRSGGADQCFEFPTDTIAGEPQPCLGRQFTALGRVSYNPNKKFDATVMLQHRFVNDNSKYDDRYRQDIAAWAIALIKPDPKLRVRFRGRYLSEDINDDMYLEESISIYTDVTYKLFRRDTVRARVDIKKFLDNRNSTMERVPNPELSLWLGYEARY